MFGRRHNLFVGHSPYDAYPTADVLVKLIEAYDQPSIIYLAGHGSDNTAAAFGLKQTTHGATAVFQLKQTSHGLGGPSSSWSGSAIWLLNACSAAVALPTDRLVLGKSEFELRRTVGGESVLVSSAGRVHTPGILQALVRISRQDDRTIFFRSTGHEQALQIAHGPTAHHLTQQPSPDEEIAARIARLIVRRLRDCRVRAANGPTARFSRRRLKAGSGVEFLRREVRRLARLAVRRVLGTPQRHGTEAPAAGSYQHHVIDHQHIRGPDSARKCPSMVTFRELALT
ncbi:hypothetical protein [Catellatospora sichuanensis]|uniref:hypothetical protein n=1 Tax=Catellatospora sichuanensis TaxID=1969805 RepID=UPI0011838231|nr:hypothetical protein [Catellatospora sichuanensis]